MRELSQKSRKKGGFSAEKVKNSVKIASVSGKKAPLEASNINFLRIEKKCLH
jgi:hypothetical protein